MQALSPALSDKARQNLKEPEDAAAVFEQARLEVVALIGEEEQKRFDWALLAMLRQAKWDKAAAVKKMCALSKYASRIRTSLWTRPLTSSSSKLKSG